MLKTLAAATLVACAGTAGAQAVTGFTGGSQFDIFYGGSTGDVIGWRFDVNTSIVLTDIGVWNADTQGAPNDGLTTDHMVGLWDSSGTLLTSGVAGPGGTVVGEWTYADVPDVNLVPGERYTIGAMYASLDGDSYVSSPSSVSLAPEINPTTNGVFPAAGDLGFVFPTSDSTNLGRFGPNFNYFIPAPSALALLGLGGIAATRRRR